jgi:hypothetical protein
MTNQTIQTLPSGRKICITSELDQAKCACDKTCVGVYDDRHTGNPSFRIFESYKIVRHKKKLEVLNALILYDESNPTDPHWKRSLPSLEREWIIHNVAYRFGLFREHTRDVDLDNREEGKGWLYFFKRGMRLVFRMVARLFRPTDAKSK